MRAEVLRQLEEMMPQKMKFPVWWGNFLSYLNDELPTWSQDAWRVLRTTQGSPGQRKGATPKPVLALRLTDDHLNDIVEVYVLSYDMRYNNLLFVIGVVPGGSCQCVRV